MAACDIATLLTSACDNDFMGVAEDGVLSRAVILQLLYDLAGESATEAELMEQACSNGFAKVAHDESLFRATALQLLCNLGGITMAACSLDTIQTDACTNKFKQAAQNEVMFRAILLQLLCNLSDGPVVVSPNGTRYRITVTNAGVLGTTAI